MPENLRLVLDILALLAIIGAFLRGIFSVNAEATALKSQVATNTAWIKGHEEWSEQQTAEIQVIREGVAYIRGKMERDERNRTY